MRAYLLPAAALLLFASGCGYHVAGSVRNLPDGIHSLGIPTFRNDTRQYKLEQMITSAVLKEFSIRTRVPVNSRSAQVDAVLMGDIQSVSSSPVTFGSNTFGSTFLVTVQMSAKLVRTSDGKVLWRNDNFLFRGRYVLDSNVTEFFSEENAALGRMSREFAASLASTILDR